MGKEIERKFLLNELPKQEPQKHKNIEAVYIFLSWDGDGNIQSEMRVRRAEEIFPREGKKSKDKLTFKSGGDLSRTEIETDIDSHFFDDMVEFLGLKPIHKDYYSYSFEEYTVEVSIVNNEFIYAEVEFDSEEEANNFEWPWPDCLIKEVTYDPKYKMANYWSMTIEE